MQQHVEHENYVHVDVIKCSTSCFRCSLCLRFKKIMNNFHFNFNWQFWPQIHFRENIFYHVSWGRIWVWQFCLVFIGTHQRELWWWWQLYCHECVCRTVEAVMCVRTPLASLTEALSIINKNHQQQNANFDFIANHPFSTTVHCKCCWHIFSATLHQNWLVAFCYCFMKTSSV